MFSVNPQDKIEIFAHRGVHSSNVKQNSLLAFQQAKGFSFSVETDLRYGGGDLVLSHDHSTSDGLTTLSQLLKMELQIAINLKEDGLQEMLKDLIDLIRCSKSFLFDGSIPQMFIYRKLGFPHALRLSEFERQLSWTPDVIWVDSFENDWFLKEDNFIEKAESTRLVFVSPEIHGRNEIGVWNFLRDKQNSSKKLGICTDKPREFREFINE